MNATISPTDGPAPGPLDDPFHDPLIKGLGIAALVVTIAIFALGGLMHWGVMYHSPAWSSHSYPAALVH